MQQFRLPKLRMMALAALMGLAILAASGDATASLVGKAAPEFTNDTWINSEPLRLKDLKGKVVLLEFWTYG